MRAPLLCFVLLSVAMGCRKEPTTNTTNGAPLAAFAGDRIPAGPGWQCSSGHCFRTCMGLPGAMMADGRAPEPTCARPEHAYCTTFTSSKAAQWECFPERVTCEANQRHYASEAQAGRDFSAVSPCTELP